MDRDVDLGPQWEQAVDDIVAAGLFDSRDEVLREGIRLVQQKLRQSEFDVALETGLDDIEAGRIHTIQETRAHFRQRYENWPPRDA